MIDFRDIFGNSKPILFLKATHKKQIFIPTHTRHDGTVIAGHYKWVHVADDHDDAKVLAGQGSHSQKVAHAKLSKQEWFNKLPDDHKAPILMAHATDHQEMDSANARVSTLTKKIIAGEKPSPSEWKAWPLVSDEKRNKALDAIEAAGKMDHFFAEHKENKGSSEPPAAAEVATQASNPLPAEPATPSEPAPDKAPSQQPLATVPAQAVADAKAKIDDATLPASNVNAKHFNAKLQKLKDMASAGDVDGLLKESYGTNTYGKKAAALANAALEALGSTHKVAAGQKAGAHPAIGSAPPAPSPKVVAATESPAPASAAPPKPPRIVAAKTVDKNVDKPASSAQEKMGDLVVPDFEEGKTTTGVKAYYEKTAQKIIDHAKAGNVSVLEDMPNPDKGQTWKGKTANSKKVIALHAAALAAAKGGASPAVAPDPEKLGPVFTMKMGESIASAPKEDDTKPAAVDLTPPKPAAKVVLDEKEVPEKPDGASSYYYEMAKKQAMEGDLAGLSKTYLFLSENQYAMTQPVVKQMIEQLVAKQGGPGVASKGLLYTEMPSAGVSVDGEIIGVAKKLAGDGDLSALKQYAKKFNPTTYPSTTSYLAKVIAALEAKQNGVPSTKPQVISDDGPKDGDTKQGADGTLVFKDGRWHKVEEASAASSYGLNEDELKSIFKNGAHSGYAAKVNELAKAGDIDGLKAFYSALKGKKVPNTRKMIKGAIALIQAKMPASAKKKKAAPKIVGASTPAAAMPVIKTETEKVGELTALVADKWKQTGPQAGSNPGGKFVDGKGQEWYCKFPSDENVVKNELLAAKFYEMLGAKVPSLRLVKKDGKLGIASKWVDGIKKVDAGALAAAEGAHAGFVFDAWLANWDVVGLSNDNLMVDKDGKAVRVDVGGSLDYRAMGGKKGAAFGNEVTELDTLRDVKKNDKAGAVFKDISNADLMAGGAQLAKMRNDQIDHMVKLFGPGDTAEQQALADKLKARRVDILKKLGVEDPWNKPPLDKTKLPVNAADLPTPVDFFNYPGKNGPLSSKEHINKQNSIDDAALIAFAQQGNLVALQNYQYDAYDKETGALIGKKPITSHPSKDIKEHWSYCCQLLESIASPSVMGLDLPPIGHGSLEEIADAAGFFQMGETPSTISADKRLDFWMKLAHAGDDFMELVPKQQHYVTDKTKAAIKSAWGKVSGVTKAFISEVQSSGWINHVFSNGSKTVNANDDSGNKYSGGIAGIAAAAYKDAIEQPEGTTVNRWMKMPIEMRKQLLQEKPGLIFQNTDSMCTSMRADWETEGPFGDGAFLEIIYAKGAKALQSHASGGYKSEEEITTLPGARFMLIEAKQGNKKSTTGIRLKLLMLPPHEGFVEDMAKQATMGKSFAALFSGRFKGAF